MNEITPRLLEIIHQTPRNVLGDRAIPITPYPPKCQCDESTWGSGRIYRESCQQY
jgi:hypothetical protein